MIPTWTFALDTRILLNAILMCYGLLCLSTTVQSFMRTKQKNPETSCSLVAEQQHTFACSVLYNITNIIYVWEKGVVTVHDEITVHERESINDKLHEHVDKG